MISLLIYRSDFKVPAFEVVVEVDQPKPKISSLCSSSVAPRYYG